MDWEGASARIVLDLSFLERDSNWSRFLYKDSKEKGNKTSGELIKRADGGMGEDLERGEVGGGPGVLQELGGGVEEVSPPAHLLIVRHLLPHLSSRCKCRTLIPSVSVRKIHTGNKERAAGKAVRGKMRGGLGLQFKGIFPLFHTSRTSYITFNKHQKNIIIN